MSTQTKSCRKHIWSRYFCKGVASFEALSIKPLRSGDTSSFSVCENCWKVSFINRKGKVITR